MIYNLWNKNKGGIMDKEINDFQDLKDYKAEINIYQMRIEDFLSTTRFDLQPDFQRQEVWDDVKQSLLIETILLGFPMPAIFTYINLATGQEPVIDGQQRLKAIRKFVKYDLKLKGLTRLKFLNGFNYHTLPDYFKNRINFYTLNISCLNNIASKKIIYDVFYRFNTGGVRLNAQEIRNCIYGGQYNDFIKRISLDKGFIKLINKFKPKRFLPEELAVRFFTLYDNLDKYKGNMNALINQYYESKDFLNNFSKPDFNNFIKEYEKAFINCINACDIVFGQCAFRNLEVNEDADKRIKYSFASFSKLVFDMQMLGFADMDLAAINRHAVEIKEKFINILLNEPEMVPNSKNNNKLTARRIRKWQESVRKIISE